MARIKFDETGERFYESGVSCGVLYLMNDDGTYGEGEAWNGLTGIDENPDGGDEQVLWADNIKYATFRAPENHKGNIKAYTYPDSFKKCNGMRTHSTMGGISVGQQKRAPFGFCYRTEKGNDTAQDTDDGYIIHVVYNCTVSPTSRSYSTQNENPDAVEFSWDYSSTPVPVTKITGVKQTSTMEFDSLLLGAAKMTALEKLLYGSDATTGENAQTATTATLPTPDAIIDALAAVT